ncbi:sialate O-acetylesterase [Rhizobium laguerreae]|uniref:Carbohydrate esterase-like sialic acid-specific acetylesterase n=1 Tax=Rhizobium laguerreae TaxID=1076926 RepID=A0AAX2QP34_9HYPH|nr:sialate O-acetylesterase [Rhizobium laguerreae]TCU25278.1 carbohydrate esterase-like sialic acid-specific acetylesterase [Rhizobium laguerreae]
MALTARQVYRNFNVDGVSSSGKRKPPKSEIRTLLTGYEQAIGANSSGAGSVAKPTRNLLFSDLDHDADVTAWVYADATTDFNGIYRKIGASGSGSWSKILPLPFPIIPASDVGAGTPNAIQATSDLPVSELALVLLTVAEANTGSPVTVAFNGDAPLTIKTSSGNDVAPGGLLAGMEVIGRASGSTFRLASDQSSTAILAAIEDLYESFAAAYLGAFANDAAANAAAGGAPITGALYYSTTVGLLRVYNGAVWQNQSVSLGNGDVTTEKMADGATTEPKLATNLQPGNWVDLNAALTVTPLTILAMGQSNALGNQAGGLTTPFANVTVWNNQNDIETLANLGTAFIAPVLGAVPFNTAAGPINNMMVHAAKVIAKIAGRPVRLVLVAEGGVSIDKWINAANVKGPLYTRMQAVLAAAGISSPVDVVLWHQGEADNASSGTYQTRWNNLVTALTTDGVINAGTAIAVGETARQYTAINAVLKLIADADARAGIGRLANLNTAGDNIHFLGTSLVRAGTIMARAAGKSISTRYGFFANPIAFLQKKVLLKDDGAGSTTIQKMKPSEIIRSDRRPCFASRKVDDQSFSSATFTKITFGSSHINVGGYYDEANSRWMPPAGVVELTAAMLFSGMTSGQLVNACIFKNGELFLRTRRNCVNSIEAVSVSIMDEASGDDYYEVWAYAVGTPAVTYSIDDTVFYGKSL